MRVQTAEVAQIDAKPKTKAGMSLEALYARHEGKVADKWSAYLREYDRVLRDFREQPVRFLEIGVQNGGSLDVWAEFFENAQAIIGCDINPDCEKLKYADKRISVVVGDANTDEIQRKIVDLARQLDVIIDDGSHRSGDIVQSFARYFPLLSETGVYIVEDLHCSYWQEYEGGLFYPHSSMSFLKRLADVVNHEHWGVPKVRSELVRGILDRYGVQLHEQELGRIHSIEFINSMCVIHKAPTDDNALGTRVIVGTEEPVFEGIHELQGMARPEPLLQLNNEWATAQLPPAEELLERRAEVAALKSELVSQRTALESLEAQLAETAQQLAATREESAAKSSRLELESSQHTAALNAMDQQLATLNDKLAGLTNERARWRALLTDRERQLSETTLLVADLADRVARREKEHRSSVRDRDAVRQKLRKTESALASTKGQLAQIQGSITWRITKPLRQAGAIVDKFGPPGGYHRATRRVRKVIRQQGVAGAAKRMLEIVTGNSKIGVQPSASNPMPQPTSPPTASPQHTYLDWLRQFDTLNAEGRSALAARAAAFRERPLISVVIPTYNPNLRWLSEAIESVRSQVYPHWELCIVDDASSNPAVRVFLERLAEEDPRIRLCIRSENGHISAATNSGLGMASGEWIAFLDHDDVLREHALFWVVDAINQNRDVRLVYSDEDKLNEKGERCDPYFKCDWNPDLFLSHNMICHLAVYQASLLQEVGGLREGFEGAQDYDLALRCVERISAAQIHHVPRVLYTWRLHSQSTSSDGDAKPYAVLAGQRALDEHFARSGILAKTELAQGGTYRTRYTLPDVAPLVSLIVPTRNGLRLVRQCIESVLDRTTYTNYEILLVDNGSDDPAALAYFATLARRKSVRVIRDDREFNYSALNNMAVRLARGEYVCLLNNDIEVIAPDWLTELVSIAAQPGVGAVGARLWYPNDTLQHGGVIVGLGGVAGHSHKYLPKESRGYCARADLIQSMSAVTAACLLIKRDIFEEVGGLNEVDLKVAFNDVDFCLRVREAGYRNVWTPYADLYHHESATRGVEDTPEKAARFAREVRFMKMRWAQALSHDPAYSPNLSIHHENFSLAWPPRLPCILPP